MATARSDSEEDIHDPTFNPLLSPSVSPVAIPRQESSRQAQRRAERSRLSGLIKSSPPRMRGKVSPSQRLLHSTTRQPRKQTRQDTITQSSPPPSLQSTESRTLPILPAPQHQNKLRPTPKLKSRSSPIRPSHSDVNIHSSPSRSPQPSSPPEAPIQIRPNAFLGAPSTWRSWTAHERTVAASLERTRAKDLGVHLYNAHILHLKAERAGIGRKRSRSRSRSQSQSRKKAKGKERAESSPIRDEDGQEQKVLGFDPPRLWTAWPLPPDQVPRETFLPVTVLGGGYRKEHDTRPSAELEECLIAVATRFAKERWESREWEGDGGKAGINNKVSDKQFKRSRKKEDGNSMKRGTSTDVSMHSSEVNSEREQHDDTDVSSEETDSLSTSPARNNNDDIPMFSSQAFAAPSPSPSTSSSNDEPAETLKRPVFMADDDHIRRLLLPSTRHILSQLDNLLEGLHKMSAYHRQKRVDIGGRASDQVLEMADIFFSPDVVARARQRCARLFDLQS